MDELRKHHFPPTPPCHATTASETAIGLDYFSGLFAWLIVFYILACLEYTLKWTANKVAVSAGHRSQSDTQGSHPATSGAEPTQDSRVDESTNGADPARDIESSNQDAQLTPASAPARTLSAKKQHFEREVDGGSCFRFWVRDPVPDVPDVPDEEKHFKALGHSADWSMYTVYTQKASEEKESRREGLPDGGRGFWPCLQAGLRALCKEKCPCCSCKEKCTGKTSVRDKKPCC